MNKMVKIIYGNSFKDQPAVIKDLLARQEHEVNLENQYPCCQK